MGTAAGFVVLNSAATALAAHEDVARVDLTGGSAAGQALGAIAGARAASYGAELAGHAPQVS